MMSVAALPRMGTVVVLEPLWIGRRADCFDQMCSWGRGVRFARSIRR